MTSHEIGQHATCTRKRRKCEKPKMVWFIYLFYVFFSINRLNSIPTYNAVTHCFTCLIKKKKQYWSKKNIKNLPNYQKLYKVFFADSIDFSFKNAFYRSFFDSDSSFARFVPLVGSTITSHNYLSWLCLSFECSWKKIQTENHHPSSKNITSELF